MQSAQTAARQLLRTSVRCRRVINASASRSLLLVGQCPGCDSERSLSTAATNTATANHAAGRDRYNNVKNANSLQFYNTTRQQVRFASKKKHSKGQHKKGTQKSTQEEDDDEIEVEDHPVPVLAKGKKAKAAQVTPEDAVEAFHLDQLEKTMDDAVERFSRDVRVVVGRVERLSPALLDSIKVLEHGKRFPLQNYATVSVSGAEALVVNLFDPAYAKPVEKAIREATDLGFNPQKADETTLRIPVPRPDLSTRSALAKKASDIAEAARTAIRAARHQGQQDIKRDEQNKVVGSADARKDGQKLQDATQKRTSEVDQILARAKKVLLDE